MKIEYDPTHDLLNIEFVSDVSIDESVELDGIIIDYSKDKRIVGIEILDAGKRTTRNPLDLLDLTIVREKSVSITRNIITAARQLRSCPLNHFRFDNQVHCPSSGLFLFQTYDGAVSKHHCLCPFVAANKKGGKLFQERQVADNHKVLRLSGYPLYPRTDVVVRIEPLAKLNRQIESRRNDPGGLLGPLLPAVIDS